MRINKISVINTVMFLLSPFLSLPFIIAGIRKKDKISELLLLLIFSLISFLYIPIISDDKVRYMERYQVYQTVKMEYFTNFIQHLRDTLRPDFIFEFLNYCFARFDIRIEWLFLLVTFLTLVQCYRLIEGACQTQKPTIRFLLLIVGVSFINIYSGVRFYLALSFFLSTAYFQLVNKNNLKALSFALLSIFTHYSMFPIIIILFLCKYLSKLNLKFVFCCSLLFILLPASLTYKYITSLNFLGLYENKINVYLQSNIWEPDSLNSTIAFYGGILWYYLAIIYILYTKKIKNIWLQLFIICAIFVNITYPVPIVFQRYSYVLKILFLIFLFQSKKTNKLIKYLFLLVCLCGLLIDINRMRYILLDSLFKIDILTLPTILITDISLYDIHE